MRKLIFLFLLVQAAGICLGAPVYEWKDDRGVLHFTDDPKKVPQRYQKKVRQREMGPNEQPANPEQTPPVQIIPSTPAPAVPPPPNTFGGHPGPWWRNRFIALRTQMAALQGGLSSKEQRLTELRRRHVIFQRPTDRVAANQLAADIDRDQAKIKELQGALAALQQDANRAGVPAEWR